MTAVDRQVFNSILRVFAATVAMLIVQGCAGLHTSTNENAVEPLEWAIALHGGAGVSRDLQNPAEYEAALEKALAAGTSVLSSGGSSLDAVTRVIEILEEDPKFNAGRGAVFTSEGTCELDASIMDGATRNCGAVSGVTTVRSPIGLARAVMEKSKHVFLVGRGAETFARQNGFETVDNEYFRTESRRRSWERVRAAEGAQSMAPRETYLGTVGCVALDSNGDLAAGTSTGGLTNKRFGRVGDSPIIGAGTFAANASCAVSCTGQGELFIRHGVAHSVSALVEHGGHSIDMATAHVIDDVLPMDSGGLIAVDRFGRIAMPFNTVGMHRACADSSGHREVKIFE